jgi:SPP1 gp7 family putative phage head morphogenesis protein
LNKREKEAQQVFLDNEKAVLKKLEKNYKDALSEINSKIELLMSRQDADMQHVIYQVEYQKALKKQVEAILETLHSNEFETVSEYLTKSYEDGFITTMYNLQGQGIPLVFPIDQEQVVNAIQHETKLSESLYAKLGLDTKDLSKKIAGEISRGLSGGQMYSEIARNIAGWAMIPKNNAMRIARTEAHRIQTKASMNACNKAKSKGADVVKQWDASLDKRTRDSHAQVDGEIRELDEPFSNGLMYPGDPSGSAAEVVNCRCALLQRARWALGNDYTKWSPDAPVEISDDGTTQFIKVDANSYKEFKGYYRDITNQMTMNFQGGMKK